MLGHHIAIAATFRKYEIVIIHRKSSDLSKISDLKYESREANLSDRGSLIKAFQGLDYVVNAAAYYPTLPRPLPAEIKTARLQMQFFLDAMKEANVKRGLYVGGAIAIPKVASGMADETGIYDEVPDNSAPYVQVKWLMDKMARDAAQQGLNLVIGIPTMTFGEYDYGPTTGRLIVDISNQVLPAYIKGKRNVVFAGDAGRGLLMALEKGKAGERYLISGENTDTEKVVAMICQRAGVPLMKKTLPLKLAKIISRFQETRYTTFKGKPPTLSSTAIAVLASGQHIDGSKAERDLGYKPEFKMEDAVDRAFNWFKSEHYIK